MSDISIAETILKHWGATVEPVPTSQKEESDWLATLDGFRLLIEEKTKLENPDSAAARAESLKSGQFYGSTTPLSPNNRVSGIIGKAAKQLRSTGADVQHDARVIWFTSAGFDRETKDHQAYNTIYGATKTFDLDRSASLQDCFFFYNSEFFRHQDIDGAYLVVADQESATVRLCLNPHSSRWTSLRDSPFAQKLVTGLVDPVAQEAAAEAMLVDGPVDRRDSAAVLNYLRTKYGIQKLMNMDMNMASTVIAVPHGC
ncbi:hypothetical protein [uncultured Xanthomonas sp.]|uniref:hypothetical protein n=1 Tax=uncultured Xanthomonas sp. TaxID=152831 RepID=UPI0025E7AE56|nr:hypothetical protein [uncultured Xanthomonas sp.]